MQIPPNFLQFNAESVAPIIANAINVMFCTGRVPEDWKMSYITPIPKKGSTVEIANYRGIAMQSCLPKILDKHLTNILYDWLGDTIGPQQHGFMRGRGTTTNLLEITQFLHENTKDGQVDVIYLDYSKAFDHIRHDLLAAKLSDLGMPFSLYRLIMNFITDRRYILKIDGVATEHEILPKSSVPQGSHIGPILYILFTNGLGLDELCYADDTKLFLLIKDMNDRNELQTRIDKIEKWSLENGLTLNHAKTYLVSYGKRKVNSIYFLMGRIIQEVDEVRDLGVLFDKKLTFKSHIDYITKRASQMIGAARRFVTGLNNTGLMTRIYAIYIQPVLEYCSVIWNQNRLTVNNSMNLLHKKITRISLNVYFTMDPDRYIVYNKRCLILSQDGPQIRRAAQAAIIFVKIAKGEMSISFGQTLLNHINHNSNVRIFHPVRRADSSIPAKSPLAVILASARIYEGVLDLSLETSTIRNKIKLMNAQNRERVADSRRVGVTYY